MTDRLGIESLALSTPMASACYKSQDGSPGSLLGKYVYDLPLIPTQNPEFEWVMPEIVQLTPEFMKEQVRAAVRKHPNKGPYGAVIMALTTNSTAISAVDKNYSHES